MSTESPEGARGLRASGAGPAWRDMMLLLGVVLVAHLLVLANPGFFNHDEWQRLDEIERYGFRDYASRYGALQAGPDFGFPVRPLGFLQQGVSALFMKTVPLVPHLIDVLIHGIAVVQVFLLGGVFGAPRKRAMAAALLFALSPLTTLSVGWVGASFDRWYVIFVLAAVALFIPLVRRSPSEAWRWPALLACSAAAILSKETAMALPGLLLVVAVWMRWGIGQAVDVRRAAFAIAVCTLPIVAYLLLRWPAILATLGGAGGPYSPSMSFLFTNVLTYAAQPFLIGATDLQGARFLPDMAWGFALAAHLALVIALAVRHGWATSLAYVAGYLLFLFPVVALPFVAAHYLYAAGPVMAFALASLWPARPMSGPQKRMLGIVAAATVLVLGVRNLEIQADLYRQGRCQALVVATVDAALAGPGFREAPQVRILGDAGAPDYIANRTFFGRPAYAGVAGPRLVVGPAAAEVAGERILRMRPDCLVVPP
ncbi:MAG: hypothetical protein O9303_10185 [Silanimonas sp.]|jgi:hypothetical protein|nr:hypothetical protein [Silanimonas sp.]